MKTAGQKVVSIILSIALIIGTIIIVCPPLTAMAITENEVVTRLENCKTTYVNGGVWCGTYYANNGSEGPWECFGFACEIFRMLYDCEMPRSYTGSTYNGATRYYKLVVNQYSNVTEVGSLSPGSYNAVQMRALLSQAKAGYVIQAANSRSQHTMIVNYVTDYGISVYDANSDGRNGIRTDASYSWEEFYNWRPYGVSLYKYIYYDDTPTSARIDINPNGGTAQNSFYVNYGEKCNLTIDSAWRAGYELSGWNLYRPADGKWFAGGIGWCTSSEISANGYEKCLYAPNLSMTLDSSWYNNCSTTVSSFTFYAVWEDATYKININANGGTAITSSLSVKYNTKCNLNPDYVQRDGYELTGWNLYRPADGKWFVGGIGWCTDSEISANGYEKCLYAPNLSMTLEGSWFTSCNESVSMFTFLAVWKNATYMVTFDPNGGECTTEQMTVTTNQNFGDCGGLPTPTRSGYLFEGWYTADGENITDSTIVTFIENQTLYAHWVEDPQHVHEYTVVVQEPTCTEDGGRTYTCGTCGHTYTEPITALGHNYVDTVTPVTCTQDGCTTHVCSRCGDSYVTDLVHATGHAYSEWMMFVDPTNTSDGVMGRKCTECGVVLDEVTVPKLAGHHVTGVTLSKPREYLSRGETLTLTATVAPDTALNKAVTWTSTNPDTATVENGVVTAVAPGITIITATAEDGGIKDFCLVQVNAVTPQNGALIDNGLISGINVNLNGLNDYLALTDAALTVNYSTPKIGTGTKVQIMQGDMVINEFEAVIYGDIDGDSWYDGTDAYFVRLVASGMVSANLLTAAQRTACDANHDGVIDNADAALLEQAGLLLNSIDQTLPQNELQTNSVYLEYCSLITQTIEPAEADQPTAKEPTQSTEEEAQPATQTVWGWLKSFFTIVLNWLLRIF